MKLLNSLLPLYLKQLIPDIYQWMANPIKEQNQLFQYLIKTAKNTAFGRQYGFSKIKTITDFKQQVPIHTYASLEPFMNRHLRGENNILWPSNIRWFAKSSGTTSHKSKFIPVSQESLQLNHMKGGKEIMALYTQHNPTSTIFGGKGLIMGGSHQISQLNKNAKYGDLSAILMQNFPKVGRFLRTPSLEIALLDNWEEKLKRMAEVTIKQNVTHLAGVPTWTLVLINYILETTKAASILDIWPNLALYFHGGVSFTPYEQQFKQLIASKNMQYWQTYNASEGFFGMQENPYRKDMLLCVKHGLFYEFMPMEELDKVQPKTVQLHEVELHKNYALIISTASGLWRYMVGDTIQFTTLHPYRIQVTGRTKHFINAFGEEVIVDNADKAIASACFLTGAKVKEYTAAPIYFSENQNGGHEWLIEFEVAPKDLTQFTVFLDQELQKVNSDYEAKRFKNMAMHLPIVQALPLGTFHNWLRSKGKLGGQHKVPRLANHRGYLEEIKEISMG